MASITQPSPTRWVVDFASQSESDAQVCVELRMSMAMAQRLVQCEGRKATVLGSDGGPAANVGSALLGIVASVDTVARVKERAADCDQQELMQIIDEEVDASRASRS